MVNLEGELEKFRRESEAIALGGRLYLELIHKRLPSELPGHWERESYVHIYVKKREREKERAMFVLM